MEDTDKNEAINWRLLKKCQLYMLLEFRRICEKHKLRYCLVGGTLLGAIRHGGYIPWDDDIDVAMHRDCYNKFIQISEAELPLSMSLQLHGETTNSYGNAFMKIRLNGTLSIQPKIEDRKMNQGIWIDIFPYDNVPDRKIFEIFRKYLVSYLLILYRRKILYAIPSPFYRTSLIEKIIYLPLCFVSAKTLKNFLDKEMSRYNKFQTQYVVRPSQYRYEKVKIKREQIEKLVDVSFEGFKFSAPANYEEELTRLYGNYMELPPKEQRNKNTQGICTLDFGPYADEKYVDSLINTYRKISEQ